MPALSGDTGEPGKICGVNFTKEVLGHLKSRGHACVWVKAVHVVTHQLPKAPKHVIVFLSFPLTSSLFPIPLAFPFFLLPSFLSLCPK